MASPVEKAIRGLMMQGMSVIANFNRSRLRLPPDGNPFLQGVHQPMSEEKTVLDLDVWGEIPETLNGKYVRIGPNPMPDVNPAAYHWFTGHGMVHGVQLSDGKANWYRNRWIRSAEVSRALGEAPAPGLDQTGAGGVVNTNVVSHSGRTFAIVEAGTCPVELTDELETAAHNGFDGSLTTSFTAHPHLNPDTGEMHAVCYHGPNMNTIWHLIVDVGGKVRRAEPIPVMHGPSIHDSMITEKYVIILDLPVTFSVRSLLAGRTFPYRWNKKHPARIGLLPHEGSASDVIWCDVDPCYIFHTSNGYEDADGNVILDAAVYPTMFSESFLGPDTAEAKLERLTINPSSRSVKREILDEENQEFPRPDERLTGKPYRYAYTLALGDDTNEIAFDSRLFKHDLVAGEKQVHDFGAGHVPGEFVFVPATPDAGEDEGWVMGYVIDTAADTTELVILRANDFAGEPQARVKIPHRIPPGFHGNWLASSTGR